jgi:hypothetical protein
VTSRRRRQNQTWAVAVRLRDGSMRYYAPISDRQGQHDWSPRATQAHRFADQAAAEAFAASCYVGSDAREYIALQLPAS